MTDLAVIRGHNAIIRLVIFTVIEWAKFFLSVELGVSKTQTSKTQTSDLENSDLEKTQTSKTQTSKTQTLFEKLFKILKKIPESHCSLLLAKVPKPAAILFSRNENRIPTQSTLTFRFVWRESCAKYGYDSEKI